MKKQTYPEAVLFSANNYGTSIAPGDYSLPSEDLQTTDGTSSLWAFVFLQSPDVTNGGIDGDEAAVVLFHEGSLSLRDYDKSELLAAVADTPPASSAWSIDSTDATRLAIDAVASETETAVEPQHILFTLEQAFIEENWEYDVILYTTETEGYEVTLNAETGEVEEVTLVEFAERTI